MNTTYQDRDSPVIEERIQERSLGRESNRSLEECELV